MNKRDLVIDSLEQCLQTPRCQDCGWIECESFECQQSPFPINLIYAALDFLKEQSWISVKERLPVGTDTVLIAHKGGVSFAWFNGAYWTKGAATKHKPIKTVTHWMPLPSVEGLDET